MHSIRVTASRNYEVHIEHGALARLGTFASQAVGVCRVAVVSDDTVFALYGEKTVQSLQQAGFEVTTFVFPHGESSKTLTTYGSLLQFLCDNRLSRSDVLIALGGGVVGDLVGFAAATYLRGIRFIQVPTTLLAMVDSSVGGKTAVDMEGGKNQVGCFYQPSLVLCDPDTLQTLPPEQLSCGYAEVIKYAVLADADFFERLTLPEQDIESVIAACVQMKRDVVAQDEFDTGKRQLLNFGHTIGHAVEACSGFTVLHGQAVAVGMAMIARACAQQGICSMQTAERIRELLQRYQLPICTSYTAKQLYDAMLADKKRSGASINLILPERIGSCIIRKVDTDQLPQWLTAGGAV